MHFCVTRLGRVPCVQRSYRTRPEVASDAASVHTDRDLIWSHNAYCVEGKVALVTGSTSGIGLGIIHYLAAKGCDVIVTGLGTEKEIDEIMKNLKTAYCVTSHFLPGDFSCEKSTLQLCIEVDTLYPHGIDILINNAGILDVLPIEEYSLAKFNTMVAINLTAPFILTKHFVPFMKQKGWGRIVNTSSIMGLVSQKGKVPYSTTKTGLIGMTKGVALEVAEFGVTCNAICPALVDTEMLQNQIKDKAREHGMSYEDMRKKHFDEISPTKKPVSVEQVASLVGFLCSDEAASITGSSYNIEAGYTAR